MTKLHPNLQQIIRAAKPLPHGFTVSDLVMQDDNHKIASAVSAGTTHDFDTQPSSTNEEWNPVLAGSRNSTSESGTTRSRTTSPAHAAGVLTSNQYDALSASPLYKKKHTTSEATEPTESSSQE